MSSSSSSPSSSRLRPLPPTFRVPYAHSSNRNSGASFRPRLPSDPFSDSAFYRREPVIINSERLFTVAFAAQAARSVILVLGEPTPQDLAPLVSSERLAFSLVIIASHRTPSLPSKVQPTIRILRLAQPLAGELTGAIELVDALEWAERVARTWRKLGGIGVRELTEGRQGGFGALAPPPNIHRPRSESNPTSPAPSISNRHSFIFSPSAPSSLDMFRGKRDSRSEQPLPQPDPSQRPFDALINFLPADIGDKALLRHTILVTTVSRPFLISVGPPRSPPSPRATPSKRASVFLRRSLYLLSPPASEESVNSFVAAQQSPPSPPIKAHLVHLLPPRARNAVANHLLSSMESFLVSFSSPPAFETKNADTHTLERARPCVLESTAFAEPVATPLCLNLNWTFADVLLSGCLDDQPIYRAWFSGASDVVVSAPIPSQPDPVVIRPNRLDHSMLSPTPVSAYLPNPVIDMLPTPPDSEEDGPDRRRISVKIKRPWRWKLWIRRPTAPPTPPPKP
ncbi:hypothetical protein F5148DRAFT_978503 [Russula earlei]|uniref:Uncharacterized protein n=1 Tax=Russula earlei TaxID=71964 RepID=A0ACC0UDY7_9AGAM|nr:hypothetical protein F5148DRAFT_978503 [Russula earlei]